MTATPSGPLRYREMRGKIARVTGGSGGVGLAAAAAFAREGATVIITSRDAGRASTALALIGQADSISWLPCDVSKGRKVEALLATVKQRPPNSRTHRRLTSCFAATRWAGSMR